MVEGAGELLIRDAEEPYALESPTTISGTHDTGEDGTGEVTGASLSTPSFSFETESGGIPVGVTARFSEVDPGTGTGFIDAEGNVTLTTELTVALDIDAAGGAVTGTCIASPVAIRLESVTPYVPGTDGGPGQVTLADPDFSIPRVTGETCSSLISGGVNELLAGPGHSLRLPFQGDLVLPPAPGCPSLTELAVSPESQTSLGDALTLTTTVTRDEAFADDPLCEGADGVIPSGIVEFRRDGRALGTAQLDQDGVAVLTSADLPVGTFGLTARYRGLAPYMGSTSDPAVSHRVVAPPIVSTTLPEVLEMGADPVEFDLTVTNTGLGTAVLNGRVDATFRRATAGSFLNGDDLEIAYRDDDGDWVPLTATGSFPVVASFGPATGDALPPGASVTRRLRIAVAASGTFLEPGTLDVTLELVQVDPATGLPGPAATPAPAAVGRTTTRVFMAEVERRDTWFGASTSVQPHTLRQGYTADLLLALEWDGGAFIGQPPTGAVRVALDGEPLEILTADGAVSEAPLTNNLIVAVPPGMPTGVRDLAVSYAGDTLRKPAEWRTSITVLPARGTTYDCVATFLFPVPFRANVSAYAVVPAAAPSGSSAPLAVLDVAMSVPRQSFPAIAFGSLPPVGSVGEAPEAPYQSIDFGFGPGGSGTATGSTIANASEMNDSTRPVDPAPDITVGFTGESGSVPVEGAPGDVVSVTLESIDVQGSIFGIPVSYSCAPLDEAEEVDELAVAGTTLAVIAPKPARAGHDVILTATVAPATSTGTVEFRAGASTVGVATLTPGGTATVEVDDLAVGTHSLTAHFFGGMGSVSTTSVPVPLVVLVATECAAFAEEGSGAVVRLVYMELLGRCPDQAGFDFWTGRLDGGTSPEVFARSIAYTPEALGVVVDDAYRTMLGRPADPAGRAFWVGRLAGHGRYDTLLADLGASGEFWSKAGSTDAGFVGRVYEQLLGRTPDQVGLDYWVGRLDAGTSRRALIVSLSTLDEPLGVLVVGSYDEILSRAPVGGERSEGIAFLRRSGDRSGAGRPVDRAPGVLHPGPGLPQPRGLMI